MFTIPSHGWFMALLDPLVAGAPQILRGRAGPLAKEAHGTAAKPSRGGSLGAAGAD